MVSNLKVLLDTHFVFWATMATSQLPQASRQLLERGTDEFFVSLASAWEIAIKVGLGKWPEARGLIDDFEEHVSRTGFAILPITLDHVRVAGLFQVPHRDPFDRLLAAQAIDQNMQLLSVDPAFAQFNCNVV